MIFVRFHMQFHFPKSNALTTQLSTVTTSVQTLLLLRWWQTSAIWNSGRG